MKGYITAAAMVCIVAACAQVPDSKQQSVTHTVMAEESGLPYAPILKQNIPDSAAADFIPAYDRLKAKITAKRNLLLQSYQRAVTEQDKKRVLDSAGAFLQEALVSNVFPFWYGTTWDFNGNNG